MTSISKPSNLSSLDENYIYADYNSTFPVNKTAKKIMFKVLSKQILNPSSLHRKGREARKILQDARDNIQKTIGALDDKEVVFTSSATEANNLVIRGTPYLRHVISAIEHPSILNSLYPSSQIVSVTQDGVVNLLELEKTLNKFKDEKIMVSVMMANNETGVIQPIKEIAKIAHKFGAVFHTDAAQSIGKIEVNMEDLEVDSLTLSAHKFGGIAGSGVLIFDKKLMIEPILVGGGQEKGLRSGTENVIAIACLSAALQKISYLTLRMSELEKLRNQLEYKLLNLVRDIKIFGKDTKRLPNTSCIYMPKVKSDLQLMYFDLNNIAVSNGSACSSGAMKASHVLIAMGATKEQAECSIRISIGPKTRLQDIERIVDCWYNIYKINSKSNILK